MNEVFLIGKVIEDIEYKFMIKKQKNAKAKIELKLIDETKVEVVAYNEQADYTLQNIKMEMYMFMMEEKQVGVVV